MAWSEQGECGFARVLRSLDSPDKWAVIRLPCRTKSCPSCWADECARIKLNIRHAMDERASFAGLFLISSKIRSPTWNAFRQRLNKRGLRWAKFSHPDGIAVVVWPCPPDAIPIESLEQTLDYCLGIHDKTRNVTSSHGVNAASRDQPKWYVECSSDIEIERLAEIAEEVGLTVQWVNHRMFSLEGTEDQFGRFVEKAAA